MPSGERIIIGIDPGYDRCGWACVMQKNGVLHVLGSGCIQTSSKASLAVRYRDLQEQLSVVLDTYNPSEAGVETLFFSKNVTTALKVSEARGVVLATLAGRGMDIAEYNPGQIKSAVTGVGNADKKQVLKMIRLLTHYEVSPKLDDEADAIATGICHLLRSRLTLAR